MLRRLALLVALLVPATGLAQVAGQLVIVPAAFGRPDCTDSINNVTIRWTSPFTFVAGDKYKIYLNNVSNAATCPASADASGTLVDTILVTAQNQSLSTLTRSQFISTSGASCATGAADSTIYVCVQHVDAAENTFRTNVSGSAPLTFKAPPIPAAVRAGSGNSALYVSWEAGTDNGVAAATYEVTAVAYDPVNLADVHSGTFTGISGNKIGGLTNGVTYEVKVVALSEGSNRSDPSPAAYGTPRPTASFWDQYHGAQPVPGVEQGGCDGGPAGLVSLLGVALALRRLRRRS